MQIYQIIKKKNKQTNKKKKKQITLGRLTLLSLFFFIFKCGNYSCVEEPKTEQGLSPFSRNQPDTFVIYHSVNYKSATKFHIKKKQKHKQTKTETNKQIKIIYISRILELRPSN